MVQSRALGAALAIVVLGACSGEGGDVAGGPSVDADKPAGETAGAGADAYVEALAASLLADEDNELWLDEASATCFATAIVDLVDADALATDGVSPSDLVATDSLGDVGVELPGDAAETLGDGIAACGIAEPMQESLVEGFGAEAGAELPSDAVTCLEAVIDDQVVGDAMASAIIDGSDEGTKALTADALGGCPAVMTAIVVGQSSGPVSAQDEACIHDVIAANTDLFRSAILDENSTATSDLGALIATTCPNVPL